MSTASQKKQEAFKRLAAQRTNAVLEKLRILGNCSNRQLYDFTDEDIAKIFRAIDKELRSVKAKFMNSSRPDFTL